MVSAFSATSSSPCSSKPPHPNSPMPDRAMRTRFLLPAAALGVAATAALAAVPDNWPRWRGSLDNGSAESGTYPVKWDADNGLLWKTPLPGKGCSTPVVWDKHIYPKTTALSLNRGLSRAESAEFPDYVIAEICEINWLKWLINSISPAHTSTNRPKWVSVSFSQAPP